jgi:hypothetical protein
VAEGCIELKSFRKCDFLPVFVSENVIFDMELLKRKIDTYLLDWKNNPKRKPLIVKGARQVGNISLLSC